MWSADKERNSEIRKTAVEDTTRKESQGMGKTLDAAKALLTEGI